MASIERAYLWIGNEKSAQEKLNKTMQQNLNDLQTKHEEASRTLSDLDNSKKKLANENSDLSRQLEIGRASCRERV